MTTTYEPATAAEEIAEGLIGIHHHHLSRARIIWLKTTTGESKARLCNALLRHAFGMDASGVTPDFVVVVTDVDWLAHRKSREALVDTLLCSMVKQSNADTGKERWALAKPDVSMFLAVVKRHGLNTTEEQQVGKLIQDLPAQLTLDMAQDDEDQELTDDERAESDCATDDEDGWEDAPRPDVSPEALSRIRGSVGAAIQ